ncbi:MAG: hypothetical protein FJ134_04765 [Deltaproteobacteria bacterium]|nr:hypothetical protein [Deltaproteobacteria bacterium]
MAELDDQIVAAMEAYQREWQRLQTVPGKVRLAFLAPTEVFHAKACGYISNDIFDEPDFWRRCWRPS